MKLLQKRAEVFQNSLAQDAAARTRALPRLGPPRQRYDGAATA